MGAYLSSTLPAPPGNVTLCIIKMTSSLLTITNFSTATIFVERVIA